MPSGQCAGERHGRSRRGVVVARYGVSTIDVIDRVKDKLQAIAAGLPGVRVVPFYDRSGLISLAVDTSSMPSLRRPLLSPWCTSSFCCICARSSLSRCRCPWRSWRRFWACVTPISANIMSLAGIAIAIGVLVDAAIVVTENAFRFLEQRRVDPVTGRRS